MASYSIVRLQVQTDRLKPGSAPHRYYHPERILSVPVLDVGPDGASGIGPDGPVVDVHNRNHPRTRDPKGKAGLTVLGTGDYERIRRRYGQHVTDGIAGESILVDAPDGLAGGQGERACVITANGPIELRSVRVAAPCVEFSRFCLGEEMSDTVSADVREALKFLDGGMRGYRAVACAAGSIAVGDSVEFSPSADSGDLST
ncbi:hypothetical protein [Spelaeicoccus albus]|uniref:MOSC domain-containing protein n=1 Tax=Spelaeicoccus albus TaxID=1280376 RepID=A0A7Z0D2J1_9MICO|nr:hypothetical protein [Spelaeicoccus albus]NYI67666.1 hypothetical protein [Spelaeicoccus albus]